MNKKIELEKQWFNWGVYVINSIAAHTPRNLYKKISLSTESAIRGKETTIVIVLFTVVNTFKLN